MAKCEHPGCGVETKTYCHASCCSGETALCEKHDHLDQMILDKIGFGAGYFGEHTDDVLFVVKSLKNGWKKFQEG